MVALSLLHEFVPEQEKSFFAESQTNIINSLKKYSH